MHTEYSPGYRIGSAMKQYLRFKKLYKISFPITMEWNYKTINEGKWENLQIHGNYQYTFEQPLGQRRNHKGIRKYLE